ncbi:glycosyltransferase family 2 protein, partial [Virgibacillus sp. DJP39]|uniref:glycosyltransferase family 2 protein n=1 Tax=Virgibacillus sp. DJP39 TaxID=3409790 RepID=UPI003BB6DB8F
MDYKLSIIVPVYKVEQYLAKCIDSILNQTYKDFELILVNDGSPDNCSDICDSYMKKDNRIKVIHKANGGLSSARNAGIQIARGEYIGFVDSDDFIHRRMYEVLYKNAFKYLSDIVVCDYSQVQEGEKYIEKEINFEIV